MIKISVKAYEDLENIYDYTLSNWGAKQAENYRRKLDEMFSLLLANPEIGRSILSRPGYRFFPFLKHTIIYRKMPKAVFIVRVRHGSENTLLGLS